MEHPFPHTPEVAKAEAVVLQRKISSLIAEFEERHECHAELIRTDIHRVFENSKGGRLYQLRVYL